MGKIKVTSIADLHGFLPDYSNYKSDIFCICGDLSPLNLQNDVPLMYMWIEKRFIPWVNNLPCDKVFLVAGNHDIIFSRENGKEIFMGTKVFYAEDDCYEYDDKIIYGTPWCRIFGNWSFMLTSEGLKEKYSQIPENVDLLLTHDVPFNRNDICLEPIWESENEHIGNIPLLEEVELKKPKHHCVGHLHSTSKVPTKFGDTMQYNCSIVNEKYKLTYEPQVFEI